MNIICVKIYPPMGRGKPAATLLHQGKLWHHGFSWDQTNTRNIFKIRAVFQRKCNGGGRIIPGPKVVKPPTRPLPTFNHPNLPTTLGPRDFRRRSPAAFPLR